MSDGGIARKRAWFNPSKPPQCTFMLHPSHLGSIGHTIELFERFEIASQLSRSIRHTAQLSPPFLKMPLR